VSSGEPFPGLSVRIVADGQPVGDEQEGEIEVAGPTLMSGYLNDSAPNPIVDGWLRTGDLGFLYQGELFVTGRIKDMVIVMGHNYYPEDLEWAAARVPGVRLGRCVAFVVDERAVVLVEARDTSTPGLEAEVARHIAAAVGLSQVEVRVVARGTIEKTTSGKLRRAAMREAFTRGEF
jgi:fatty-acyl-CoA synthase